MSSHRSPSRSRTRRARVAACRRPLTVEPLELRLVLNASFDHVGITSLRQDPLFSAIDGQLPNGQKIGVAILDTGVAGSHPGLRSNFVAYYDAVTLAEATTIASLSRDPGGHGTHVAGTAVASNPDYGVATRGGLVGVRVLLADGDRYPSHDPIYEGLQWVSENYRTYNIRVVNMSLGYGGTNFNSQTAWLRPDLVAAIDELEGLGITVVTASGNSWANTQVQGSAFPGNVSTITVGNTWGQSFDWMGQPGRELVFRPNGGVYGPVELRASPDQLAGMSQRSTALPNQLMAPGMLIESSNHRGGTASSSGTSMASPLVAGVVALMQDAAQTFGGVWLQPEKVLEILRNTADRITDSPTDGNQRLNIQTGARLSLAETGGQFLRINAHNALRAVRNFVTGGSTPVTVLDPNGTSGTAVVIPDLNGTRVFYASGSIGSDGTTAVGVNDVDLLRFNLTSRGVVSVKIQPVAGGQAFDPYLRLFDANGLEIAVSDDATGLYPTLQSVPLQPGTYFAGVSSYDNSNYTIGTTAGRTGGQSQGDYEIIVSLDNPDPNGVIQGAAPATDWLVMDFEDTGSYWAGGIIGSDPAPLDGDPRVPIGLDDVDMFEVVAPDSGWLNVRVYAGASSAKPFDAALRLFDPFDLTGRELAFSDNFDAFDPYIRYPVTRGQRLFAAVSHSLNTVYNPTDPYGRPQLFGEGAYRIAHWFETGDLDGTAWASLVPGAFGNPITGSVGFDGFNLVGQDGSKDVDFYAYAPSQASLLEITVAGLSGFVPSATLWKWDPTRQQIQPLNANTAGTSNFQIVAEPGEYYYVSVTGRGNEEYLWYAPGTGPGGDTGSYTVTGNTWSVASAWQIQDDSFASTAIESLPTNGLRFGDLGRDKTLYRGTRDVDLYRLQPQASGRIEFEAYGDGPYGATPVLRLFDAAGNELGFSQTSASGRNGSSLIYNVVTNRTYYVGVSGWASSGNLRAYSPNGTPSPVDGSTGGYIVSAQLAETFQPVESAGSVMLAYDSAGNLRANGTLITANGQPVRHVTSPTATWRFIAADVDGGRNTVVLRHSSGALYFWRMDASWGQVSGDGWAPTGSPAYFAAEQRFSMDFNGDGAIGERPLQTIELTGSVTLTFDSAGNLRANGTPITANGQPVRHVTSPTATWRFIAADVDGGRNTVVLRHSSGALYFWRMDASWRQVSGDGWAPAGSLAYFAVEQRFGMDFNGDGGIGLVLTPIESAGSVTLAYDSAGLLRANGISISLNGSPVRHVTSPTATWRYVAADVAGGRNTVVLRHSSGALYFWRMDASWNQVSGEGWTPAGSPNFLNAEQIFGVDFNGDGTVGLGLVAIESSGSVTLAYDLAGNLRANGVPITQNGFPVRRPASSNAVWRYVAAEAQAGRNTVVLKHSSGALYFWRMNAAWAQISGDSWTPAGTPAFYAAEAAFGVDFDGNGRVAG